MCSVALPAPYSSLPPPPTMLTMIEIEKLQKGKCISHSTEAKQAIWN